MIIMKKRIIVKNEKNLEEEGASCKEDTRMFSQKTTNARKMRKCHVRKTRTEDHKHEHKNTNRNPKALHEEQLSSRKSAKKKI
jgi:hypothetical protein